MTSKEYNVERCKLDVQQAESKLRDAEKHYNEGFKKESAKLATAKAEMEIEVGNLKEKIERAKLFLEAEKLVLKLNQAELERGFEQT